MQFNRAELAQMMRGGLHSFALELGRIVAAGMLEDESNSVSSVNIGVNSGAASGQFVSC